MRTKKIENGVTTYYLRSSVLGNQVVAEINAGGGWQRGYVYLGLQLMVLQYDGVYWVHQDPVVKSQRITDTSGNIVAGIELDPWGGDTSRSWNQQTQPHKFTTYERDENGSDEAMHRRYNRWWGRFDQPDPYGGSYSLTDPQSFNRYSYVQNDPVNFIDPSGLDLICFWNVTSFEGQEYLVFEGCIEVGPRGPFQPLDPPRDGPFPGPARPQPPAADPQRTREERCLKAIEDARRIKNEIDKTIAKSLAHPGGFDQGHVDKVIGKKVGLEDALKRIDHNCNNHEKHKFSQEIEGFRQTLNAPNPKMGDRLPIQEMKVTAGVLNVLGAVGAGARAAWRWIFAR